MEDSGDFVADSAEDVHLLVFAAAGVGGIIKAPVVAVHLAGEQWTDLVGITTDGDHGLDLVREKTVEVLGVVTADVDTDFCHRPDCERVDVASGF